MTHRHDIFCALYGASESPAPRIDKILGFSFSRVPRDPHSVTLCGVRRDPLNKISGVRRDPLNKISGVLCTPLNKVSGVPHDPLNDSEGHAVTL